MYAVCFFEVEQSMNSPEMKDRVLLKSVCFNQKDRNSLIKFKFLIFVWVSGNGINPGPAGSGASLNSALL